MVAFLIKSIIAMAVLLALYHLLLEREKMHRFNRFYLLAALVFSITLPFVSIPVYIETIAEPVTKTVEIVNTALPSQDFTAPQAAAKPTTIVQPKINYWPYAITGIYALITLVLAIRFLLNIGHFIRKSAANEKIPYRGATLILLKEKILPHTFLNCIFINEDDYKANAIENDLYTHELTHVKQRHTLDILFIEVLKTIFWFNPLLYFYKRAIQLNHEFLADDGVIKTSETPRYQRLLLQKTACGSTVALASNLNFSLTKKRFNMMTKTTPKWRSVILKISVAPVISAIILLSCMETVAKAAPSIQQHETTLHDTLTEKDKRRDSYYAGVRIVIEDRRNNIVMDKPYEELALDLKRKYLFYVPEPKTKKNPSAQEFEDYKDKSKYAIWLDDKNIDNTVLNNYKNTDIAYVMGSSVFKNARTKKYPQPYQFHLYTNSYFDKNLKDGHLKYPEKIFKRTLWTEKKEPGKKEKITSYTVEYSATEPDKFAGFKEGFKNFPKYVEANFNNPYKPQSGILLRLKYIFDVEADGSITNIKIERITENPDDVDKVKADVLEQELKRVIKLSQPQWFPAIKNEKPIPSTVAMPFVLDTKM